MQGLGTDCQCPDYAKFELEGVQSAASALIRVQPFFALLNVVVHLAVVEKWCWKNIWPLALPSTLASIMLVLCASRRLRTFIVDSRTAGICLQSFVFVFGLSGCALISSNMQSVIQQHRSFVVGGLSLYICFMWFLHVPFKVHNCVYSMWYLVCWFGFHTYVGYLRVGVVVTGLSIVAFATYFAHHRRRTDFRLFQTLAALHEAEESMKRLLDAHEGMLKSIFDASCVCSVNGTIRTTSPQLEEMLGNVQGLELGDLAASRLEGIRLSSFLSNVKDASTSVAMTIQTSLSNKHLSGVGNQSIAEEPKPVVELKIFGIKIIGTKASNVTSEEDVLFLGMQETMSQVSMGAARATSFAVTFDAGTPDFRLSDSQDFAGVGTLTSPSLTALIPESCMTAFDDWVCDEVQNAPDECTSSSTWTMSNLPLSFAVSTVAQRAWLEIQCQNDPDSVPNIPVTLRVEHLRPFDSTDSFIRPTLIPRGSPPIEVSGLESVVERSTGSTETRSRSLVSFPIAPWDSVSQCDIRRRGPTQTRSDPGDL